MYLLRKTYVYDGRNEMIKTTYSFVCNKDLQEKDYSLSTLVNPPSYHFLRVSDETPFILLNRVMAYSHKLNRISLSTYIGRMVNRRNTI